MAPSNLTEMALCGTQENTTVAMLSKSIKLLQLLPFSLNRNKIRYALFNKLCHC